MHDVSDEGIAQANKKSLYCIRHAIQGRLWLTVVPPKLLAARASLLNTNNVRDYIVSSRIIGFHRKLNSELIFCKR